MEDVTVVEPKQTRANYGWEEDEEDLKWKQPDVIIPYPLHCPITAFGSMDDERVLPDHVREWLRLSRWKNKAHFSETGGYYFFHKSENESIIKQHICNICLGVEESESEDFEATDPNEIGDKSQEA